MEADGAPFILPPSLRQCSVLRAFQALAAQITGKLKQTLKSLSNKLGTYSSESRA